MQSLQCLMNLRFCRVVCCVALVPGTITASSILDLMPKYQYVQMPVALFAQKNLHLQK